MNKCQLHQLNSDFFIKKMKSQVLTVAPCGECNERRGEL